MPTIAPTQHPFALILLDGLADKFQWSTKKNAYVYKNNKPVTDGALYKAVAEQIAVYEGQVQKVNDDLFKGKIGFEEWQKRVSTVVRNAHTNMMRFGKGGKERTEVEDYLEVARELKNTQYKFFKKFATEIKNGKLTEAQIRARSAMYTRSARFSYENGKKRSQLPFTKAKRRLGSCGPHCPECLKYAAWGWTSLEKLVLPTRKCTCLSNCCCTVDYKLTRKIPDKEKEKPGKITKTKKPKVSKEEKEQLAKAKAKAEAEAEAKTKAEEKEKAIAKAKAIAEAKKKEVEKKAAEAKKKAEKMKKQKTAVSNLAEALGVKAEVVEPIEKAEEKAKKAKQKKTKEKAEDKLSDEIANSVAELKKLLGTSGIEKVQEEAQRVSAEIKRIVTTKYQEIVESPIAKLLPKDVAKRTTDGVTSKYDSKKSPPEISPTHEKELKAKFKEWREDPYREDKVAVFDALYGKNSQESLAVFDYIYGDYRSLNRQARGTRKDRDPSEMEQNARLRRLDVALDALPGYDGQRLFRGQPKRRLPDPQTIKGGEELTDYGFKSFSYDSTVAEGWSDAVIVVDTKKRGSNFKDISMMGMDSESEVLGQRNAKIVIDRTFYNKGNKKWYYYAHEE